MAQDDSQTAAVARAQGLFINALTGASAINTSGGITVRAEGGTASGLDRSSARAYADFAAGIHINQGIAGGASLTNTGAITVTSLGGQAFIGADTADSSGNANARAEETRGIFIDNAESGNGVEGGATVTNHGAITVLAQAGTAEAGNDNGARADAINTYGIYIDGHVRNASVTNTGAVTVTALGGTATVGSELLGGYGNDADADVQSTHGIYINRDVIDGSVFRNEGAIVVRAQSGTATAGNQTTAEAAIRFTSGLTLDGAVDEGSSAINLGEITVSALAGTATTGNGALGSYGVSADARIYSTVGISLEDEVEDGSRFDNAGRIAVLARAGTATAGTDAGASANIRKAYGIELDDDINAGTVTNTGAITVTALGGTATIGSAGGGYAYRSANADVENVVGIYLDDRIRDESVVNNSGAITVLAQAGRATSGNNARARAETEDVYGIHIDANIDTGSSVTNTGAITVTALAGTATVGNGVGGFSTTDADAYIGQIMGIFVDGSIRDAVLNNSADIALRAEAWTATGGNDARAHAEVDEVYGIAVNNDIEDDASLINSGAITITVLGGTASVGFATGSAGDLDAYSDVEDVAGIQTRSGGLRHGSTLNNSGAITVRGQGGSATAGDNGVAQAGTSSIGGIVIDEDIDDASLINSGAIMVSALGGTATMGVSTFEYGVANTVVQSTVGIEIGEDIQDGGRLDNSGAITVLARGGTSVAGHGFSARASTNKTHGISIDEAISGGSAMVNTGAITVTALGGTATVSDAQTAPGDEPPQKPFRTYAQSFAYDTVGIFVGDGIGENSRIENRGDVAVVAVGGTVTSGSGTTSSAMAQAIGIQSGFVVASGTLENHGDLSVSATGGTVSDANGSAGAEAHGFFLDDGLAGTFTNSGDLDIRAIAGSGGEASAIARGIEIDDGVQESGLVNNTGAIFVETGGPVGEAYGIRVNGDMNGTVFSNSTVMARTNGGPAYAIHLASGSGLLDLRAPALLEGGLLVDGHDVTMTSGATHSVHWTFDDTDTAEGVFTLIEGDDVPWFVRDGGTDNPQYATYAGSARAALVQETAGLAQIGAGAMGANLSALLDGAGAGVARGPASGANLTWGGAVEYRRLSFAGAGSTVDHDVAVAGVSAGHTRLTDSGLAFGVMLGVNQSSADVDSFLPDQRDGNESRGAFAGLGFATDVDGLRIDGGLRFGRSSTETRRLINDNFSFGGVAVAEGAFDTNWVALSGRIAHDIAVSPDWTLTPSLAASYTRGHVDGYTESGAVAAASVAAHSFGVASYEVGVTASRTLAGGIFSGSLSYVGSSTTSDDMVVSIFGDTNNVGLGAIDFETARLGVAFNAELTNGMNLEVGGDVLVQDAKVIGGGLSLSLLSRF